MTALEKSGRFRLPLSLDLGNSGGAEGKVENERVISAGFVSRAFFDSSSSSC